MMIRISIICMVAVIFGVFAFAQGGKNELVEKYCSTCHTTNRVYAARKAPEGWDSTFARMVGHGLKVTPAEEKTIKAFLYTLR